MKCLIKNRECLYAGSMKMVECKELEEQDDFHEYTICYNDAIGRDTTKCK